MKKIYTILYIIILIATIPYKTEAKTGLHINTELDFQSFMNPTLNTNNTFVYNNFIFYLYSNESNTFYSIQVNNVTIYSGFIEEFNLTIYWKCKESYLYNLIVEIGEDQYHYSNIYIFNMDMTNMTQEEEQKNLLEFTKEQYRNIVREIQLRIFSGDMLGVLFALILSNYTVREVKKNMIKEI